MVRLVNEGRVDITAQKAHVAKVRVLALKDELADVVRGDITAKKVNVANVARKGDTERKASQVAAQALLSEGKEGNLER